MIPLELTAAASAADAGIQKKKKKLGSGNRHSPFASHTALIISNNEIDDIIEIAKSLEDSGLLLEGVTKTVENEVKEQKGEFLGMLLGTLGKTLLGKGMRKGIYRAGKGKGINGAGEGIVRAGYGCPSSYDLDNNKMDF